MAELVNKFHVKDGNTVYECTSYTTTTEATPVVDGGDCWQIRNNGVTAYLGLWPTDSQETSEYSTPLTITKSNTEYYVETQVISMVTVTINQTDAHQTIHVLVNGTDDHTSTFDIMPGASYAVMVVPDTGYDAGTPNYSSGTISGNMTVSATASALQSFTVTIVQIEHCTITVTCNNQEYTSNFTAHYGDTWTATIVPDAGYNAGTLEPGSSGTVTDNITITALDASVVTYTLTLAATANQTITLYYTQPGGSELGPYTSTSSTQNFTVATGTTWRATIAGATAYNAGTLSPGSSGTVNADVTVTASAAVYKTFTLTKSATNASTNQTLTVQYQNKSSNGTFGTKTTLSSGSVTLGYGSHWWGTVSASTGWNAGAVTNAGGDSSSMTSNVTVSVAVATRKTFTLTKSATNASTNQTLKVYYKNITSSTGSTLASSWTELSSGSVTLYYQAKWYTTITASTGWDAGTVTNAATSGSPGTITANTTVSVAAATRKTYTLTKSSTNASTNQTLKVYYKNITSATGSTLASSWTELTSGNVTLRYGAQWYTSITASTGYTAGTVTNAKTSSSPGTITGNVTVSVTAATVNTYYLRYGNGLEVRKTNDSGASISSGSKVNYNQVVWVNHTINYSHYTTALYKNSSASGTVWTTKTGDHFTFNMPASQVYMKDNSYDDDNGGGD